MTSLEGTTDWQSTQINASLGWSVDYDRRAFFQLSLRLQHFPANKTHVDSCDSNVKIQGRKQDFFSVGGLTFLSFLLFSDSATYFAFLFLNPARECVWSRSAIQLGRDESAAANACWRKLTCIHSSQNASRGNTFRRSIRVMHNDLVLFRNLFIIHPGK